MKKHISLLVAAVMVLTLIYTPAGLVYGAEEEGPQADSPAAAEPAEENAEEPATEVVDPEPEEKNQTGEGTVKDEETTGSDTGETEENVNAIDAGEGVVLFEEQGENPPTEEPTQEEPETGTITNLSVTKQTDKSIALKWDAFIIDPESDPVVSADSYKVFLGDEDLTPEGLTETTKTITDLKPKTDYPFTVKAYKSGEEEPIAVGTISSYTYPAKPAAPKTLTAKKAFPNYVISWTKDKTKAGYQFRYSTTKGKGTVKTLSAATNKQTIQKLKNGKTYYFQVRVKDQYKNDKKSAKWSAWKTVKVKAATTGWKAVVKSGKEYGKKYYYVNGVMQKNKEFWLGKLKYYVDKNGVWRGGSKYMWGRCKKQTSGTDTMLVTSRNRHTVCIFKKIDGTWCCQYEWLCSVGKNGSKTPHGKFYVRSKKKSFGKGHTCWYATRYHKKYPKAAFHSVLYKTGSKTKIKDGRLGKNISNGCVRLALKNAKWIYDNLKKKSRILIY